MGAAGPRITRDAAVTPFAIACLQLELPGNDNLGLCLEEIDSVLKRFPWVQMVLLGELAVPGPDPKRAEPMPGPAEQAFQAAARRHGIWLIPGSLYERDGDHVFNTAPVIDPNGSIVDRYRKMFPFLPYERDVEAGDRFVVFDVPGVGRFGVSTCYDGWFPETTRTLAWMGAEVILHPTMTNTIDRDVELAIARASAVCHQCYFLDVNVAGRLGNGRSIVAGPGGEVVHQAGAGRELFPLRLDLDAVRSARRNGWHGLGQPLKSFRDSRVDFPAYPLSDRPSSYLQSLGPLERPTRMDPEASGGDLDA